MKQLENGSWVVEVGDLVLLDENWPLVTREPQGQGRAHNTSFGYGTLELDLIVNLGGCSVTDLIAYAVSDSARRYTNKIRPRKEQDSEEDFARKTNFLEANNGLELIIDVDWASRSKPSKRSSGSQVRAAFTAVTDKSELEELEKMLAAARLRLG